MFAGRRAKKKEPIEDVSRFALLLTVKAAIAESGRTDLTFELDPEDDPPGGSVMWWVTVHTPSDEVEVMVSPDGWYFCRDDGSGYLEDITELPGLSEMLRTL